MSKASNAAKQMRQRKQGARYRKRRRTSARKRLRKLSSMFFSLGFHGNVERNFSNPGDCMF